MDGGVKMIFLKQKKKKRANRLFLNDWTSVDAFSAFGKVTVHYAFCNGGSGVLYYSGFKNKNR